MEHLELEFLAGDYFHKPLPSDKWYLLKYFKSDTQLHFLKYFSRFSSVKMFCAHTGIRCNERYLWKMQRKYRFLEAAMASARKSFDFKKIAEIESGKLKLRRFRNVANR